MPHRAVEFAALHSSPAPSNAHFTPPFKSGPASFKSGYKHRSDELSLVAMDGFSLITDRNLLLQSRGVFDGGTDASMFAAGGYTSVANFSTESNSLITEYEHKNKGNDLFFCDLPELGGFEDFDTNMSCFDSAKVSSVQNQSATATLIESSVSAPDQIKMTPTNIHQQMSSDGMNHTPSSNEAHASSLSSSGETNQLSLLIDAELFVPFTDDDNILSEKQTRGCEGLEAILCSTRKTQAPAASSIIMLPDESVITPSTCSGPDLVAARIPCSKRKLTDPLRGTPDMLLEGLAENPLEMYFPPLTTFEQSELLMSDTAAQTYGEFAGSSAPNCAGMQFCSTEMSSAVLHEQLPSTLVLEAVPVKDLGFQKLQNGMNQMDVATKGRIRDALYRLANFVEQRHYVASTSRLAVGSSKRFTSGRWTETVTNPMDQSVAQLLLQKPPFRNNVSPSLVTADFRRDSLVSPNAVVASDRTAIRLQCTLNWSSM